MQTAQQGAFNGHALWSGIQTKEEVSEEERKARATSKSHLNTVWGELFGVYNRFCRS